MNLNERVYGATRTCLVCQEAEYSTSEEEHSDQLAKAERSPVELLIWRQRRRVGDKDAQGCRIDKHCLVDSQIEEVEVASLSALPQHETLERPEERGRDRDKHCIKPVLTLLLGIDWCNLSFLTIHRCFLLRGERESQDAADHKEDSCDFAP